MGSLGGRPEAEVDWELFDKLIIVPVLTVEHLADMLKVGKRTLERKVFEKYELSIGALRQERTGPLRHKLFSTMLTSAFNGNTTMQIWLSKNLFGWSDKIAHGVAVVGNQEKLIIQFSEQQDKKKEIEAQGETIQ